MATSLTINEINKFQYLYVNYLPILQEVGIGLLKVKRREEGDEETADEKVVKAGQRTTTFERSSATCWL